MRAVNRHHGITHRCWDFKSLPLVKEMQMLTSSHAEELFRRWIDAWNGRDLEQVLKLYDDDSEMVSPVIVGLGINTNGRITGKGRLRAYWSTALQGHPDLKFKVLEVLASPDSIVVRYENERAKVICEYL
jgi:ketosteroid isomerase-like protein